MRTRRISLLACVLFVLAAATLTSGCSKGDGPTTITVAAASSLSGAFTEAKAQFEADNPGTTINLSFGGSSSLGQQINNGAPIDVFASADNENMQKVSAEISGRPATFTTNTLEIMVARGNPLEITSLVDLSRPGLIYVTCAPEVPVGKYSAEVLSRAGVVVTPSSLEPDVKGIVTKITSGEADAGIVYATDVQAAGDRASGVAIPMKQNLLASYPIALMRRAAGNATADAWIDFIKGSPGQSILTRFGFVAP
jgi:molybdate transport system substrate-binding protein